jgi:hypothetical protein
MRHFGGRQAGRHLKRGKGTIKKLIKVRLEAIMIPETAPPIFDFFNNIKNPRIDWKKCYPPHRRYCHHLSGGDGLRQGLGRHRAVRKNQKSLTETGYPQHDVYRRVFNRLNTRDIEGCFMAWVKAIKQEKEREVSD